MYGLAAGLAEALSAVHQAGVVHRDLKPSNIILSPSGPRLVDFGIARLLDQTAITVTGHMVGSPGWVSPEEYRGDFAGFPADVYGWALMVCFAASGRPPYGVGRPEVLALRVLTEEPDLSAVPAGLRAPVEAALAKDPRERPESGPLLEEVTRLWCARHDEPYEAPTVDVTRILARTWHRPVEETDMFAPPPGEAGTPASVAESPGLQPAEVPATADLGQERGAPGPEDTHVVVRSSTRRTVTVTMSVLAVALLALAVGVVSLTAKQIRSYSITMSCKTGEGWREWRGTNYRVNTVIAIGVLTREDVSRLQARLA